MASGDGLAFGNVGVRFEVEGKSFADGFEDYVELCVAFSNLDADIRVDVRLNVNVNVRADG